uniref:ATP synthase subunit b, chloroplastic n=1 Tax=Eutreptiella eupharyngea TaxID=215702 RepID=A0A977K9N9_9EUGL|nr:ATP synthase CF0 subunit I [Eutreptiella eupharyngea]UXD06346.1 ATP synthase CF0 subunit I [Eutreptiella eupharyngea]
MIVSNINVFASVAESEGFGINTDLIETNVLNLAVVIGVLVYFGKDIVSDTLKTRKEAILKSLQDADNKFQEATDKLNEAKKQFEFAKVKAEEIRAQGLVTADKSSKKLLARVEDDIKRLEESKVATLRFEEEKAITEVCEKVSRLALEQAVENLNKRLDPALQKRIIQLNIALLGNLATK